MGVYIQIILFLYEILCRILKLYMDGVGFGRTQMFVIKKQYI